MSAEVEIKEVTIYNSAIATFGDGAKIIANHQLIVSKANEVGENIINAIQNNGGQLTPELDKRCNDFIAKCNQRKKELEDARKPITQVMDEIKRMFTTLEKDLDAKTGGTKAAILQEFRNEYARVLALEAQRKREEADRKARIEQDRISINAELRKQIVDHVVRLRESHLDELRAWYRELRIDNYDETFEKVNSFNTNLLMSEYNRFVPNATSMYILKDEIEKMAKQILILSDNIKSDAKDYSDALKEAKAKTLELLPGRKKELERIATANKEEAQRLQKAAEERAQREEAERLRQLDEQKRKDEERIEAEKSAAEMDTLFNQSLDAQVDTPQPEARAGFEINVTNRAGWVQIFQLWFQHEGNAGTDASVERKTLGSMKKFCQKHAHKTGEKIDSKFIQYEEVFTAVNRSA